MTGCRASSLRRSWLFVRLRRFSGRWRRGEASEPEDRRLRFRIGANLGDVVVHEEDVLGDAVNVAAGLQGLAPVGGVCLSRAVMDQIRRRVDVEAEPLGPTLVKTMPEPVDVGRRCRAGTRRRSRRLGRLRPIRRTRAPRSGWRRARWVGSAGTGRPARSSRGWKRLRPASRSPRAGPRSSSLFVKMRIGIARAFVAPACRNEHEPRTRHRSERDLWHGTRGWQLRDVRVVIVRPGGLSGLSRRTDHPAMIPYRKGGRSSVRVVFRSAMRPERVRRPRLPIDSVELGGSDQRSGDSRAHGAGAVRCACAGDFGLDRVEATRRSVASATGAWPPRAISRKRRRTASLTPAGRPRRASRRSGRSSSGSRGTCGGAPRTSPPGSPAPSPTAAARLRAPPRSGRARRDCASR